MLYESVIAGMILGVILLAVFLADVIHGVTKKWDDSE